MINKLKLGFFKKTVVFWWMKILRDSLLKIKYMDVFHTRCKIENHGTYSVNKHIKGGGVNCISAMGGSCLSDQVAC